MTLDLLKLLVQAIILGVLTGSVYALMSSGLTLIFGLMDVINVAQGILVIVGSYLSYTVVQWLHLDPFLGLLITMPVMFGIGYLIQWAFVRQLKVNRLALSILVMYAVAQVAEGLLNLIYTATPVHIQEWYVDASINLGFFYLPYIYLFCFLLSVVLLAGLYFIVYRTRFGQSLRASMQNRTAAALIGIDVDKVSAVTFGIGVALACAGGLAYGTTNAFNASSSYDLIARLLVIIVLGGMGSLEGAFLASMVMLIVSNITDVIWSPVWSSTVFYVLLVILLLFRPQGLFGRVEGRKQ
ncbi:branched-chain amino acid ABC transporter permease [Tengunoibacter tsumagoiensis]|uniref:Branched-chain amino acid ABC transporter permease n=1 Tax=Tengunoibacter tsumagoiensis TaxID=2014871 RepID=A0A402A3R3_9CHLR|nr:branched-chain amino acid ABC transporter permease [Tengunoibacter tsumagoiensis]GCE13798.1 branched-chain amino acid ABC transporter permease [Tengunoibacter tsumagoiensis]